MLLVLEIYSTSFSARFPPSNYNSPCIWCANNRVKLLYALGIVSIYGVGASVFSQSFLCADTFFAHPKKSTTAIDHETDNSPQRRGIFFQFQDLMLPKSLTFLFRILVLSSPCT
jgi:hypothetical protein